ncbi:hypothetical protein VY86_08725 [Photorhabdus thracensis]|uniref:Type I restriction modification DNA specificity domain-containing protein n=2 Tax=Morganellaceae TaxID=1903414 RepID=A0A0F7LSY2_9GAMM|nr:hypothetical protein VY86_08725 [Photorhabdus thracensis]
MNEQNAPKQDIPVGYKQTEIGMIPEDWKVIDFGDLFETQFSKKEIKANELVSFVGMQDVSENAQLINYWTIPYSQLKTGLTYFERGDVLVAKITPCFENGKGCISDKITEEIGYGSTEFHVLRAHEKSDSKFIYYITTKNKFRFDLQSEMIGSAGHRRVPLSAIHAYKIPCPLTKEEQTAIANALSDVDTLLNELEKLIAKKQAIKTATMQQLLTGKTRLPQFALREDGTAKGYKASELGELPEDWEIVNFSSIAMLRNDRINPKINGAGDYCIELEHIGQGTGEIEGSTETSISSSIKNIFSKDDILFGKLRAYLKKYWKATQDGVCSTEIWVLKAAPQKSTSEFIFQTVQTERFIEVASEAYGTHMPRADWKIVKEFQLAIPLLQEQTAIATILSDMDEEIQSLRQRLDKTRQIKQGMMQELLTGKTRLVKPTQQRN